MKRSLFSSCASILFATIGLMMRPAHAQLSITDILPDYASPDINASMAVDTEANRLYILNSMAVTVLDGVTQKPLTTYPVQNNSSSLAVANGRLYVASGETLTLMNAADGSVKSLIPIPRSSPNIGYMWITGLKIDSARKRLYFSAYECKETNNCSKSLRVMDTEQAVVLNSVEIPNSASYDLDPVRGLVYLTGVAPKTLTVLNENLDKTLHSVPLEEELSVVGVDPVKRRIYLSSEAPALKMAVMDGNDHRLIATVGVPKVIGLSRDSNSGDLYLLSLWSDENLKPRPKRQVHRWDGVSADANGMAALSGTLSFPELFRLLGVNSATGKVYGFTYGIPSRPKTFVMEPVPPTDTTPPTITATLERGPDFGEWYKSSVKVKLKAEDNPGGSGIYYLAVPNPAEKDSDGLRTPLASEAEAKVYMPRYDEPAEPFTYTYYAVDFAQNKTMGTLTFKFDNAPPRTTARLSSDPGGIPQITLSATDLASGVKGTFYQVDDGPELSYTEPLTLNPNVRHKVTYYSRDHIGHEEDKKTITTYISGDLDNDGEATIGDAVIILRYVAEAPPSWDGVSPQIFAAADLDGNDKLNVADAVALLRRLVGL